MTAIFLKLSGKYSTNTSNGIPVCEATLPNFLSSWGFNALWPVDMNSNWEPSYDAYRLIAISKTDAGIPSTITLPLRFTFD